MRFIRKLKEPKVFKKWKRRAASEPDGATFPIRDRNVRSAVVAQMRAEQGGLCAYTMWPLDSKIRISIEHIYCRDHHPDRALDYKNMVLCAKGNNQVEFGFGESQKGNMIVTEQTFVSPLIRDCESRFAFHDDGSISASKPNDNAAAMTIEKLKLDNKELNAARRRAIRAQVIGEGRRKPVSLAQARKLAERIADAGFGEPLPAFAIALRQSAQRFVKNHERHARRRTPRQAR